MAKLAFVGIVHSTACQPPEESRANPEANCVPEALGAEMPVEAIGHAYSLHYRISVEGWSAWLLDEAKTFGLEVFLEAPALMLVYGLMHWS